jgi:hypothetical protein
MVNDVFVCDPSSLPSANSRTVDALPTTTALSQ